MIGEGQLLDRNWDTDFTDDTDGRALSEETERGGMCNMTARGFRFSWCEDNRLSP